MHQQFEFSRGKPILTQHAVNQWHQQGNLTALRPTRNRRTHSPSLPSRQTSVISASPLKPAILDPCCAVSQLAPLAQSAEQLTLNQWVPGSSPGGRTFYLNGNNLRNVDVTFSEPQKIARRLAKRMAQLVHAASHFEYGRTYDETEVNSRLMALFDDHVFARRLLIEWGFLNRKADGSQYWLNPNRTERES